MEQPHAPLIEATPLALADNSVCFLSHSGTLINLDAERRMQWVFYMPWDTARPRQPLVPTEPFASAIGLFGPSRPTPAWPHPPGRNSGLDAQNTGRCHINN